MLLRQQGRHKRVPLQLRSNLVGLRLVKHYHKLGLLGPGIAHHGLDLGPSLAYQRLGLGLDHQGLGSVKDSVKDKSSLTSKAVVLGVVVIFGPVDVIVGIKCKTHDLKKIHRKLDCLFCCGTFIPNLQRNSLHPNKTNRISTKIMECTNAKGMLSRTIMKVTRQYANAKATTQEMVSQVLSSNFSFLANDGELIPCPYSLGDCSTQLSSLPSCHF
jgi:hypothetical protein